MTNPIDALIAEKGVLLADGATGTNLFAHGAGGRRSAGTAGTRPRRRRSPALHQDFVDAGADIILTNSFGGTRHRLKLHHAQDRVFELNKKAAEIARAVADKAGRKVIVAGSVGPTGELLVPLGAMTYDEAVDAFAEQIEGLKAGGAEIAWIETMSAPRRDPRRRRSGDPRRPALHLYRLVRHGRPHDDGPAAQGHPWRRRRPRRSGRSASAPIAASAPPTSWRRCST